MRALTMIVRFFFYHFYHGFAWTYDFVAATVSIGRWNAWTETVIPFIQGDYVLEIGHGPGHLQRILRDPLAPARARPRAFSGTRSKQLVIGLDESRQMGHLAKNHLKMAGDLNLVRGLAQMLPLPTQTFDTVVSTFPAEYIFDQHTISDVYRVLHDGGRLVMLPAAWIVGRGALDRLAAWLFRVTGETPRNIIEIIGQRAVHPLERAGFHVETQQINLKGSVVLIVIARK